MNEKRKVIGIDFGSSQSSIAIMEIGVDTSPSLFNFEESAVGEPMQTVLLLDSGDEHTIAVGNKVKGFEESESCSNGKFISDFKRLLGTDSPEAKNAERYTLEFLRELAKQVEKTESRELSTAKYATCIACPAVWSENQVDKLKSIVNDAGFPSDPARGIYVLREPVAALRSHLIHFANKPENFLVMDFGGGTLDVCVVETDICGQDPDVVGIAGDASLGGRDFDLMLIEHLESVYKDRGLDYSSLSSWERFRLDRRIRDAKRIFSENFSSTGSGTQMTIPLKWPGKGEVPLLLSKEVFRNLVTSKGISDRIRKCIRDAIADSGRSAKQITRAILTGGSSRWFFVRDIVREECGLSDNDETIIVSPTPFTDVAIGCAMSKARSGAAAEREGLWVKWRVNGEVAWHGPKNLLRPGRQNADVEIRHQHLCEIPSSRSLHPIRIELSFHWGDEESQPTPYLEGKSAVVDFHARSNHPLLKRPRDVINAMRGRTDRIETAFRDVYQCFLHCKEYPNGGPVFKLEIRDWEASKGILEAFDWNNPKLIDVTPGKFSRRGWFGIGTRKELAVEAIGEIKSTDGRESPSWKSKIKSLVSRIHRK